MVAAEINWNTLAGRLIEARTRRGLTRRQACAAAGYASDQPLRDYENGKVHHPHEDVMLRFANALGCDPVWLMYGRGEPNWTTT
jgi:transcriptional regulator with XRE-family HTH domain